MTTYKQAGVDIENAARLVDSIKPMAQSTQRTGCMGSLGGFGALFDLKASGYRDPILVSSTDGVGTKVKLAHAYNMHDTIGIDLVAMCVNDILAQGAEPLFFLDYFATGKLENETASRVISGIAQGCKQAGCALVGGETAEMPGMYASGEYDLAGFSVGALERGSQLPIEVNAGDVLLGLPSSGLHSNGYSLARKILADCKVDASIPAPFDATQSLLSILMRPTRIYVKALLPLIRAGKIKALAHITGGGITENLPRVYPDNLSARISLDSWNFPPLFSYLQTSGGISRDEMLKTFNCGIGMIIIATPEDATSIKTNLAEPVIELGIMENGNGEVRYV